MDEFDLDHYLRSEYLIFKARPRTPPRTTYIVDVLSRRSNDSLGMIHWHPAWRQYVFAPCEDTIFNTGCMDDIKLAITVLHHRRQLERGQL